VENDLMKFIKDQDFCLIATDKFEEKEGIKRGQRVYIAGHRAFPISEDDPYTQRIKFFVHLVNDGEVVFGPLYVMDAISLKLVGKREQEKLAEKLKFKIETEVPADASTH
jgi:hypothetical protein